jgi:monoterpene epsilon-lactone hydrolase
MNKLVLVVATLLYTGFLGPLSAATSITAPANLSPEAQEYLSKARVGAMGGSDTSDPKILGKLRTALGNMFLRSAKKIDPDMFITEQPMGDVTGFWVNSQAPKNVGPMLIYLHGGGHVLGSAQTNLGSAIRIRRSSELPILSVEYRLAPEHPFPANVEDAVTAYEWLLQQGYSAEQIGVYGDSAGGGLTLSLALTLRERELPLPGALAILSPSADYAGGGDTRITLRDTDPIIRTDPGGRRNLYVGDTDVYNPVLSPVYADYAGLPPLLIQAGTRETLLSDSVRIAQRARAADIDVTLDIWDGMWHGWHDQPELPEAEQACASLARFFVRHLVMPVE